MDDAGLLELINQDANAGMERLMDQYAGVVYAVVRQKLEPAYCVSSDIEDCVADVFSKFYAERSTYDPNISSLKTYLCVIARNHAINVSKQRKRKSGSSLDEESIFASACEVTIDGDADDEELRRRVIKAVEDLGDPDSKIIFRKFYYGESSKEIAKALGLTVSNVDTRTHRALKKLRKTFGGDGK